MKKVLAALTLALLCSVALAVSAANATHGNGTDPNHDFVNGSVIQVSGGVAIHKVHVNAKSAPDGSQAQGMMFVRSKGPIDDIDVNADVTCLNVVGNSATIGGEVTRSNHPAFPVGSGIVIDVTDNGEPGDQDAWLLSPERTPPEICPEPIPLTREESRGNFVVHDAP
jgi:hypothetical protein